MTPGESNIYNEVTDAMDFSQTLLYPNPADELLSVDFGEPLDKPTTLIIYSVLGQEMMRASFETGVTRETLDISFLDDGFYLVTLADEYSTATKKIFKKSSR